MPDDQGLDAEAIERETAVPLPERDAMSVVAGVKLVPIADINPEPPFATGDQVNPPPHSE